MNKIIFTKNFKGWANLYFIIPGDDHDELVFEPGVATRRGDKDNERDGDERDGDERDGDEWAPGKHKIVNNIHVLRTPN